MPPLTNSETALLGLLAERPMHPYQIEQEVKFRDMRFWTELSMSSIYKLLRSLEQRGLVLRQNEISDENRLRKLYSLSTEGRAVLTAKLESILSEPEHVRWQVDIATYNLDLLPENMVAESLRKYTLALQQKIRMYEELLQFLKEAGCPPHRYSVATRPVYLLRGELQWIESQFQLDHERDERTAS
jgi:DNA-binding PadR family transcriptional regulator